MAASSTSTPGEPLLWRGAIAGLAAGVAGSLAMHLFQTVASQGSSSSGGKDPATVKAADAVVKTATGVHLERDQKAVAGNVVHYVTGALLGIAYGIVAEYRPEVTKGMGNLLGGATSLLLDEGTVPALGLADKPDAVPASTHLFGLSAHAVYGMAAESARRAVVAAFPS